MDNCNCDGYTNSAFTLSISSASESGLTPWYDMTQLLFTPTNHRTNLYRLHFYRYSEACSSTLASTYSSDTSGKRKVVTTDLHGGCTSSHTGTSASAPMAAGIVALVLEANANLTWRDIQHVTIRCAQSENLQATDWLINAVGRNYSHSFGYGIMDAGCMV